MGRDRSGDGTNRKTRGAQARLLDLFGPGGFREPGDRDDAGGPGLADAPGTSSFSAPVALSEVSDGSAPPDRSAPARFSAPAAFSEVSDGSDADRWTELSDGSDPRDWTEVPGRARRPAWLDTAGGWIGSDRRRAAVGAVARALAGARRDGFPDAAGKVVRTRLRLDPGRRGAAAVVALVVITAAVVGWRAMADAPQSRAVAAAPRVATVAITATGGAGGSTSSVSRPGSRPAGSSTPGAGPSGFGASGTARLVVDVVGRVRRPGLVRLATGSRVDDAVRAAGGALPGTDLSSLNLARLLVDGEQLRVGVPGTTGPGPGPGGAVASGAGGSGGSRGPVNLNTATVADLDALPGVGPVLAQRIVDWRTAHGQFDSVDQLNQVSGIGDAKFADLKAMVTV